MSNNSSTEATKPPYLRTSFWSKDENKFWESASHTEKSKALHRQRINEMFNAHRNQDGEYIPTPDAIRLQKDAYGAYCYWIGCSSKRGLPLPFDKWFEQFKQ
jgi:hypothetical protein